LPALDADAGESRDDPRPPRLVDVSRVSSGEQVRQYVRRLIFDGTLKHGHRVPQDDIASTLRVSRLPVREALVALDREGWITLVPRRGAYVNPIDESAVRDHYELFGLIYGFAARRATERQGEALGKLLPRIQKQIAAAGDNPEEMFSAAIAFHRAVVTAAGSHRIRSVLRQMPGIVPGNFFELVPGSAKVGKRGTAVIVRAVRQQDGAAAAAGYVSMMRKQGDLVAALLRARGLFG
jgi:DNA-binding GntR family transcriptional regulator